jgi:hypothetical protein
MIGNLTLGKLPGRQEEVKFIAAEAVLPVEQEMDQYAAGRKDEQRLIVGQETGFHFAFARNRINRRMFVMGRSIPAA